MSSSTVAMEQNLLEAEHSDDVDSAFFVNSSRHDRRQTKNYMAGVFLTAIGAAVALLILLAAAGKITDVDEQFGPFSNGPALLTPVVNTSCGTIRGSYEDAVYVFRGIRYATPPVDGLRWKSPQPLHMSQGCWEGLYPAYRFQSSCYQYNTATRQQEGSEDCLFLNVWTPRIQQTGSESSPGLDVMVYIHGGGLMEGSGNLQGKFT